jgi:uroporphyrin-3 C-methyltransferase
VTDATASTAPRRNPAGRALAWLVLLLLLAVLGWRGWRHWQGVLLENATAARADDAHWRGLEERIDALRRDQRAQAQRIAQADATNRVLREEILGVGQRAALLEDSVDRLAEPLRRGSESLRLDEAEMLLSLGEQRLRLAGDLAAAKRAYAMAAGVIDALDDPALLDIRQALQQERAELDALDADPKAVALRRLDAFSQALPALDVAPAADGGGQAPWWERAFARIVRVQPSDRSVSVAPGERRAGYAALQLELALARSAAERRDTDAWRDALRRAGDWLPRLWPRTTELQRHGDALDALRSQPLQLGLPALGSTLAQLRAGRAAPPDTRR